MSDTIFSPSGLIVLSKVNASDDASAAMLALKSPVIMAVLTMGNMGLKT